MKQLIILIALVFCSSKIYSQETYQYYFIQGRPTGKLDIEVWPEKYIYYPDIDTLIVSSREVNKKGVEVVEGKRYSSFSEFFNALSAAGLEFVNYYKWNTAGGATGIIAGRVDGDFFIFRKKVIK